MNVNRKALVSALKKIKPAIASQDHIPVMRHFCFTGRDVYAYDEVSAIVVRFPTEFKAAVPDSLLPILESYATDEVDLTLADNNLIVKGGARAKVMLPVLPSSDFVYKRHDAFDSILQVNPDFLKGVTQCLKIVSNGVMQRASLMGVTLSPDFTGCLYSTDNKTISRYRLKQHVPLLSEPIVLPYFFCQQLVSWMPEGNVELAITDRQVLAIADNKPFLVSQRIEGEQLEFAKTIKSFYTSSLKDQFIPVPEGFVPAINRSLIVNSSESAKEVVIDIECDTITVSARSSRGDVKETIEVESKIKSDRKRYVFRGDVLSRALGMCDEINFLPGALGLRNGVRYLHLVGTVAGQG